MCLEMDDMSEDSQNTIIKMYNIFSAIFIAEALFKIFILGFCNYLHSPWNRYSI